LTWLHFLLKGWWSSLGNNNVIAARNLT